MKIFNGMIKTSAIAMLLTGFFHALSFFSSPIPANEDEKKLFHLLTNYKRDLGFGFARTTEDLFIALSACFSLLCILGGLQIFFIMRKLTEISLLQVWLNLYLLIFGICFLLMSIYTFLPPIIFTGFIVLTLLLSKVLLVMHKKN
jgi:hypothetical protein